MIHNSVSLILTVHVCFQACVFNLFSQTLNPFKAFPLTSGGYRSGTETVTQIFSLAGQSPVNNHSALQTYSFPLFPLWLQVWPNLYTLKLMKTFKSVNFLCTRGLITTTSPGKLSVTIPKLHPAKLGQYSSFSQDFQCFHALSHISSNLSTLAFNIGSLNSRQLRHQRFDAVSLHLE